MLRHERECIELRTQGCGVRWSAHNAVETPVSPELLADKDAVVIGGSGDFSVYDPRSRPWVDPLVALIGEALEQQIPGFGICFGHQLLGEVMGGTVALDPASAEAGTVRLELTAAGAADPVFGRLDRQFWAHTGHTDRVAEVPAGVELLAFGGTLTTQAFRVRGAPFWSAQFHPDLTGAEAQSRYLAYQAALGSPAVERESPGPDRFQSGADETAQLLAWFLVMVQLGSWSTGTHVR